MAPLRRLLHLLKNADMLIPGRGDGSGITTAAGRYRGPQRGPWGPRAPGGPWAHFGPLGPKMGPLGPHGAQGPHLGPGGAAGGGAAASGGGATPLCTVWRVREPIFGIFTLKKRSKKKSRSGLGTMLAASGPEFCPERRGCYVKRRHGDPNQADFGVFGVPRVWPRVGPDVAGWPQGPSGMPSWP